MIPEKTVIYKLGSYTEINDIAINEFSRKYENFVINISGNYIYNGDKYEVVISNKNRISIKITVINDTSGTRYSKPYINTCLSEYDENYKRKLNMKLLEFVDASIRNSNNVVNDNLANKFREIHNFVLDELVDYTEKKLNKRYPVITIYNINNKILNEIEELELSCILDGLKLEKKYTTSHFFLYKPIILYSTYLKLLNMGYGFKLCTDNSFVEKEYYNEIGVQKYIKGGICIEW